ncbi:MAG: hypothetical protein M3Z57_02070 [Candidatus Dormibacteraeota bacterium]|nr:hypothetical protein [Candidatus Dormibacteraeota bacterium]
MLTVVVENLNQTGPVWWTPLALGFVILGVGVVVLGRIAEGAGPIWRRPADALARITGLPAWSAAAIVLSIWSLAVALVGFTWDVAWHVDLGRDQALFTPPHVMILVGLAGIGLSALTSVILATVDRAPVGVRIGRLRLPWSSLPMGLMGAGALVGFPIDDYWHSVYGIDVTMWSPTHLLMIGGASLTPIAAWLMLAEAGPSAAKRRGARFLSETLAAATLVGLSTFQLEFDLGIPQWQALYHPVLIALAMGVGLVAAREALGAGGALRATAGFLVMRGLIALLVGPVFGLSLERFPLYLAGALLVEGIYLVGPRIAPALRIAIVGLLLGTVGMAAEWGWTLLWSPQPWQPRLLGSWWVVVGMSLVGAVLGAALGRAVAHTRQVAHFAGVGVAFALMVALLAIPFPRQGLAAAVTLQASPAGDRVPTVTREGRATFEQDMNVAVSVSPSTALDGADVARILTWQGGGLVISPLHALGGGRYAIDGPIPTGASWKSIVFIESGDVVGAVPVSFPADPTYELAAIPAPVSASRTAQIQPASAYLTRETRGGSALPAVLAYTTLGIVFLAWCVAVIGVGEALRRRHTASLSVPAFLHGGR